MKIRGCVVIKVYGAAPSILFYIGSVINWKGGVNMTWREGAN